MTRSIKQNRFCSRAAKRKSDMHSNDPTCADVYYVFCTKNAKVDRNFGQMESSTFFKAYLSSDWWWLEITFMYGLECQESLSAAPDTLHSRNTDAKSAPTGPTSSRAENIAFPYLGKLPGFQNTTMNAPSESSRPRRGIQRSPADDLGKRTRPVPH